MAREILQSDEFNGEDIARIFEAMRKSMPSEATALPVDGPRPAGAYVFDGPSHVRLIVQYNIRTDSHSARFVMLIETPDAD